MQRMIPGLAALVGIASICALPVAAVFASLNGWLPSAILKYDLRPFRLDGLAAQVWVCRAWFGTWVLIAMLGVLALVNVARTRPRRPLVWMSLPLIFGIGCLVAFRALGTPGPAIPVASLQGFEHATEVQFPPGTRFIEGRYLWGMDKSAEGILTMPRAQVLPFFRGRILKAASRGASSSAELTLSHTDRSEVLRLTSVLSKQRWHPEAARSFVSARTETHGTSGRVYSLLADLDDPKIATVYLEYWTY